MPRLVSELALDDDRRDTFARHVDGVGVAELVRRDRRGARRPGQDSEQRADGQLDADGQSLVELSWL